MKTLKRSLSMKFTKRILSLLLAVVMIITMFSSTLTSLAALSKFGNDPDSDDRITVQIVVPELIYKTPGSDTFQYYIAGALAGEAPSTTAETQGSIKIITSKPVDSITLTAEGATNLQLSSTSAKNTDTFTSTITGGSKSGSGTITWTFNYTVDGVPYESVASTYVYQPYLGQVGTESAWEYDTSGDNPKICAYSFIVGIHSVTGGKYNTAFIGTEGLTMSPLVPGWSASNLPSTKSHWEFDVNTYFPDASPANSGGISERKCLDRSSNATVSAGNYTSAVGTINVDKSRYTPGSAINNIPNLKNGVAIFWVENSSQTRLVQTCSVEESSGITRIEFNKTQHTYEHRKDPQAYLFEPATGNIPSESYTYHIRTRFEFQSSNSDKGALQLRYRLKINLVDKAALRALIQAEVSKNRQEREYSAETYAAYRAALMKAYEVLGNPTAVASISSALKDLNNAVEGLIIRPSTRPTPTFYVPELIFVDSTGTVGEYFYGVNNDGTVTKNVSLDTAAAGALVYWNCEGATNIKITAELSTSQYLGNDGRDSAGNRNDDVQYPTTADMATDSNGIASITVGGTPLTGADASSTGWTNNGAAYNANMTAISLNSAVSVLNYRFIEWTATYTYNGGEYTQTAYTILYNNNTVYRAVAASFDRGHEGWSITDLHLTGVNYPAKAMRRDYTNDKIAISPGVKGGGSRENSSRYEWSYVGTGNDVIYFLDSPDDHSMVTKDHNNVIVVTNFIYDNTRFQNTNNYPNVNVRYDLTMAVVSFNNYCNIPTRDGNYTVSQNIPLTYDGNNGRENWWSGTDYYIFKHSGESQHASEFKTVESAYNAWSNSGGAALSDYPEYLFHDSYFYLRRDVYWSDYEDFAGIKFMSESMPLALDFSSQNNGNNYEHLEADDDAFPGWARSMVRFTANTVRGRDVSANSQFKINPVSIDKSAIRTAYWEYVKDQYSNSWYNDPDTFKAYLLNAAVRLALPGELSTDVLGDPYDYSGGLRTGTATAIHKCGDVVLYTETLSYNEGDNIYAYFNENAGYKPKDYTVKLNGVTVTATKVDGQDLYTLSAVGSPECTWTFNYTQIELNLTLTNDGRGSGTFSVEGGLTDVPAGKVELGKTVTITATALPGYHFAGWTVTSNNVTLVNASNPITTFTMPEGDVEIAVKFDPNVYVMTFDPKGGTIDDGDGPTGGFLTSTEPQSRDIYYGQSIAQMGPDGSGRFWPNVYRVGYTFQGYYNAEDGNPFAYDTPYTYVGNTTFEARWSPISYEIVFDPNGGTGTTASMSQIFDSPTALTPNGFTRDGYSFAGWSTTPEGGVVYSDGQVVSNLSGTNDSKVTLYAVWTLIKYTITFDANGGNAVNPITYNITDTVPLPTPTREGYTFKGWKLEEAVGNWIATTYTAGDISGHYGDVTLTAEWELSEFTVTFDAQGGTASFSEKKVALGKLYGAADGEKTWPTVTREGYTFDGWYTAATGGTEVTETTEVTAMANHTLYAQWTANTYEVTFNGNGGVPETSKMDVTYDSAYGELPTVTREGYTFDGWWTDAVKGNEVTAETTVATASNHTLYAHWTANTYTVTFDAETNGGVFTSGNGFEAENTKTVEYDSAYNKPDNGKTWPVAPTKVGYTFNGWYTESTGGTNVLESATVTTANDHTLYAQYTANTYTVTFDGNGGTSTLESKTVTYDEAYGELPTANRTGYTFDGWFTATAGGSQVESTTKVAITSAQTLYAQWTPITYTVAFDANGGEGEMASQTFTYDVAQYLKVNEFTRTGYTFLGWAREASATVFDFANGASVLNLTAVSETVTLYAIWSANGYTVAFNANGGEGEMANQSFVYDVAQNLTANAFTKTGYNFIGWKYGNNTYTDEQEVKNLTSTVGATVTLDAQWTPITYTIIFDANSEDVDGEIENIVCEYDQSYEIPVNGNVQFTKVGYTFLGWATTADGDVVYNTENYTINNLTTVDGTEITLYAKWAPITYTVTYTPGDGEGTAKTYTFTYDEAYTALSPEELGFSKIGHNFVVWSSEADYEVGAELINLTTEPDGNVELVAYWEPIESYKVVYEFGLGDPSGIAYAGNMEWPVDETEYGFEGSISLATAYESENDYVYLNDTDNEDRRYILGWTTEDGSAVVEYEFGADFEITAENAVKFDENDTLTLYAVWSTNYYPLDSAIEAFQNEYFVYENDEFVMALLPAGQYDESYAFYGEDISEASDIVRDIMYRAENGETDISGKYSYNTDKPGYYVWFVEGEEGICDFTEDSIAAINEAYEAAMAARIENPYTQFDQILTQNQDDTDSIIYNLSYNISAESSAITELVLEIPDLDYRITAEDVNNTDLSGACAGGYEIDGETYPPCEYDEADGTYHSFNSIVDLCTQIIDEYYNGYSIYTDDSVVYLEDILYTGDNALYYQVYDIDSGELKLKRPSQYFVNEITAQIAEAYHDLELKDADYTLFEDTYAEYIAEYWGIEVGQLKDYFTEASISVLQSFYEDVFSDGGEIKHPLKIVEQDYIDGELTERLKTLIEELAPLDGDYTEIFRLISTIPYDTSTATPYPEGFSDGSSILSEEQYNNWFTKYANADAFDTDRNYDKVYLNNYYTADSVNNLRNVLADIDWTYNAFNQDKISGSDEDSVKTKLQNAINALTPKEFKVILLANYDFNGDGNVDKNDALFSFPVGSEHYYYGSTCTAAPGVPTYGGWTFKEWNSEADGTGTRFETSGNNNSFSFIINNETPGLDAETNTIYIYAIWETNKSRVKFELSGGTVVVTQNGIEKVVTDSNNATLTGDFATTLTFGIPTRVGYTFADWTHTVADGNTNSSLNKLGNSYIYTFGEGVNTTDTITAVWTANVYTVSFNKNSGEATGTMADQAFTYGVAQALAMNTYKRIGYTFEGWSKTATGAVEFVNGAMIAEANALATENGATVTLYAVWTQNTYTLTIDTANGSEATTKTLVYGETYEIPAVEKTGYTFASWSVADESANVATTVDGNTVTMGDGNATVTAQWTANKYEVVFDGNGATSGATASMTACEYDSTYVLTANGFEKTGYTFLGWSATKGGTVVYEDGAEVTNLASANNTTVTLYAVWDILGYTFTITNDGKGTATASYADVTGVTTDKVNYNTEITVTATANTGYHFDKWVVTEGTVTLSDETATTATFTMPAEDVEINATFAANTYTVIYEANGGTGEMAAQTFTYDVEQALAMNTYKRIGYTFNGWSRTEDGTVEVADGANISASNALATENGATVTLYAVWTQNTYTLTIDTANGSEATTKTLVYGETYEIPAVEKTGYTFASWSVADESANVATTVDGNTVTMGDGNATVTAQWTANKYTIVFDGNGETGGATETMAECVYDADITLNANGFEKTGYSFRGWATDASGAAKYADKATVKNLTAENGATVTLYAVWGVLGYTFTITNDGKGTATASYADVTGITSAEVDFGTEITVEATANIGYHFNGWTVTGVALQNTSIVTFNMPANAVTIEATFAPNTYTVTFDVADGIFTEGNGFTANDNTKTVTYDATYGENDNGKVWPKNPTKTGYSFAGWFTNDGDKVVAADVVKITENLTLIAQYTVNSYKLTVNNDGKGTATASYADVTGVTSADVDFGTTVTLTATANTGYHFSTWTITTGEADLESMASATTTFTMPATDLAIKAIFAPNTYTVTFNTLGGTFTSGNGFTVDITVKTVVYMSTYGADDNGKTWPADPVKAGHTFLGWFTAATEGTEVTSGTKVEITENQTLYAQYQVITYTLTLDAANGEGTETVELDFAEEYTLPTVTRIGYTFSEWIIETDDSETTSIAIADGKVVMGDGNATVKATWIPNTYTVIYEANGGTGEMATQTFRYDEEGVLATNTFALTGYLFANWNTAADGTGETYANGAKVKNLCTGEAGNESIVLYAQWSMNDFTVTFNVAQNGGSFVEGNGFTAGTNDQSKTITLNAEYGSKAWPTDPVKNVAIAGKTLAIEFIGWYTEAGVLVESTTIVTTVGDHTLYARWIDTTALVEAIDEALEINANHYTEDSLKALDTAIIDILGGNSISSETAVNSAATIEAMIAELDVMENDGAAPKINVFENKDVVKAEVTADGTYDNQILGLSQNHGDISFVYPGKAFYTYYCYTNSANPMILVNTADLVNASNGRISYPTKINVDEEGVNAKGQLLTRTGQVNSGWMNYTVDTDTSERSAEYTIYNKPVNNPYEGVLTYVGSNHAAEGETSENYDYYQNSEYIVLTPTFVQRNAGKKQYALYTLSATDDSYNAQTAETASLAGAGNYGDYAEGTSIATSSNASVTPNYTVTIFVEYYNTMAQNADGSYRTDAGGQNVNASGDGMHNGGTYIEVYNAVTAADDDWNRVDYVYRSLASVTDDDIIKPLALTDGKYTSYLGNDPEFGQNDRGSFYTMIASDNPAVAAYWNAYDTAIAEGKTVKEAREAAGLAATPIMNEEIAKDIENGVFTVETMNKSQQAVKTEAGEYIAWPYTTTTKYYSQFYASAKTREEALVYAHFYDRYGNEFTNILVRDLQDSINPTASYTQRGQVVVSETGGSTIEEIKITKYQFGGNALNVEPLSGYVEGAVWNEAHNQFTVHLGEGENYYKYSLSVTDKAGNFASVDLMADTEGNVTVTIFDEVMGGTYGEEAHTPPENVEIEETSAAAPEMSLMTIAPATIDEIAADTLGTAAPAEIEAEELSEALPDVYTFSLNGYYTVNLFAKVGRDYELTLKTTEGGIIKAYIDGEFASPEAGKIIVPGGSDVQIKVATKAGYELSSLSMIYNDGTSVMLDGSYVAEIDDDVVIKAVFVKTDSMNKVTVENGMVNGKNAIKVSPYSQVTVVANEAPEGMKFAYWAVGGTPVSYDAVYTFIVTGDTALTAVYTDAEVTKTASISMDAASESHITVVNNRYSLSYSGKLTIPEGYEIVEFGMVLSNQDAQYYTSENLVIGGEVNGVATVKIVGETLTEQGQCKLNINNVAEGVTRAGRLFMTVRDADGNEYTVYSNTWSVLTTPIA